MPHQKGKKKKEKEKDNSRNRTQVLTLAKQELSHLPSLGMTAFYVCHHEHSLDSAERLQAVSTTCTDKGVYVAAYQLHVIPILSL